MTSTLMTLPQILTAKRVMRVPMMGQCAKLWTGLPSSALHRQPQQIDRQVSNKHTQTFQLHLSSGSSVPRSTIAPASVGSAARLSQMSGLCQFCRSSGINGGHERWASATAGVKGAGNVSTMTSQRGIHSANGPVYAGHNKWSKVKHIKGPKDVEKSRIFTRIGIQIKIAVKEGGPNPDTNSSLASAITLARSKAMPKATIDGMIKKTAGNKQGDTTATYEVRGPGNSAMLVTILTDNAKRTRSELMHLVGKNGGTFGEQGSAMFAFERKGVVRVPCEVEGQESMTFDDAEELAIDIGAEEVVEGADDEGQSIFMFLCDPADLRSVRDSLVKQPVPILSSSLEFVAQTTMPLAETDMEAAAGLISALEGHEEVVKVFDNIVSKDQ